MTWTETWWHQSAEIRLFLAQKQTCHFPAAQLTTFASKWNSSRGDTVLTQFKRFSANCRCWLTCLHNWTSKTHYKRCRSTGSRVSLHTKLRWWCSLRTFWSHLVSCGHLLRELLSKCGRQLICFNRKTYNVVSNSNLDKSGNNVIKKVFSKAASSRCIICSVTHV